MDKKENETKQLFLETLQKIGCPYTYNEEDDTFPSIHIVT